MSNTENELENLMKEVQTCKVDLILLMEKINKELEKDKDNKTAFEAKRIVKKRLAVREAVTGIPQQYK